MNEQKENVESQKIDQQAQPQKPQQTVLLGSISYEKEEDYENFLQNLDVNQSIFVLIASANFCQARGVFNLDESELIAKAIKTIKKSSKPVAQAPIQKEAPVTDEDMGSIPNVKLETEPEKPSEEEQKND